MSAPSFRNLTPHRVVVIFGSEQAIHLPTSSVVSAAEATHLPSHELHYPESWSIDPDPAGPVRVSVTAEPAGDHAGVPLAVPSYGEVTGLPSARPHVLLIVSKMVADASPERQDLVWPGDVVRDGEGQILGCRCLHRHRTT